MKSKVDSPCPDGIELHELEPLGKQLLVRALDNAEISKGGIVLLSAPNEDDDIWTNAQPPSVGVVHAQGDDCTRDWDDESPEAVVFLPNSGVTFVSGGQRWIVFEEGAVLGTCIYKEPEE